MPAGTRVTQTVPYTLARGAQVVKATVLAADADARRLRLSLVPGAAAPAGGAGAPAGGDALAGLQPGDVVEGRVRSVTLAQAGAEVRARPQLPLILTLPYRVWARALRPAKRARRRAASPAGQAAAARSVRSSCAHVCGCLVLCISVRVPWGGRGGGEGEEGEALMAEALVEVRGGGGGAAVLGKLDAAHLADHPAAVAALRACVTVRRPASERARAAVTGCTTWMLPICRGARPSPRRAAERVRGACIA